MDNVTFIEIETSEGKQTHAIIDHGNDEFTSMPKSVYDAQQVAQATLASELSNPSTPQAGA
jgi:hypothetical protein